MVAQTEDHSSSMTAILQNMGDLLRTTGAEAYEQLREAGTEQELFDATFGCLRRNS